MTDFTIAYDNIKCKPALRWWARIGTVHVLRIAGLAALVLAKAWACPSDWLSRVQRVSGGQSRHRLFV